ncbi:ABC-2 family transporter protein [Nocardiopsis sp. L17-MgMaSL7]|uniref:ABC transporter permease n=1 Tax=Nocardiopsis sp. L17-MgMaSL7 TaxID=1938893 RepID=UPI000D70E9B0|nr:ABC-2 family transporter protein [Nocardiopsis sp. L17-MgMaSL7]PWV47982.1 ABC-2 type transport system permease protein [Nocardiopsis sp. L17-MgMaSL7]
MRVHCAVYARGLRRYSTYRAATIAGVFTNSVFGAINAMVLLALFEARPEINGYDATDAVTQVFVAQALLAPLAIMGPALDLSERIRTGAVGVDLLRPVPLLGWNLAQDMGRVTFDFAFRSAPTFAVGALLFTLALPVDPLRWLATTVSFVLAVVVGFALRYLYSVVGFWLMDTRGVWAVMGPAGPVLAGMLLPLTLFPAAVADVLRWLPWASMVQIPAEVFLGKESLPGGSVLGGLSLQLGWAVALLSLAAWLTGRATRRVVVQGG